MTRHRHRWVWRHDAMRRGDWTCARCGMKPDTRQRKRIAELDAETQAVRHLHFGQESGAEQGRMSL